MHGASGKVPEALPNFPYIRKELLVTDFGWSIDDKKEKVQTKTDKCTKKEKNTKENKVWFYNPDCSCTCGSWNKSDKVWMVKQ